MAVMNKKTLLKLATPVAAVIVATIGYCGTRTPPIPPPSPATASAPPAPTTSAPAAPATTPPPRIQIGGIGDNNTIGQIGDNNTNLNVTVQPGAEEKHSNAGEAKPPFNPKLRSAPNVQRKAPTTTVPSVPPAASTEPSPRANASEPVRVIALSEKPQHPGRAFDENGTDGVSLSGTASAGVVSAAAVAGTLSAASISVLEPECGTAAFGASLEDVVLTTPPPHGDLLCHVRVQRTGYPDVTREIWVPAEQ